MKIQLYLFLLSLGCFQALYAQPLPDFQDLAERVIGQPDPDLENAESLYENLLLLYEQPIDLNTATAQELQQLNLLSPEQISALIQHRRQTGPLISVYELQAIPAFSPDKIRTLLPLVTVRPPVVRKDFGRTIFGRNTQRYFIFRWERTLPLAEGYNLADTLPTAYFGRPNRFLLRFRAYNSQKISMGFTLEKDAGEQVQWSPTQRQYGPDYLSGHISIKGNSYLRRITLGDFWIQAGQGLVFGRGLALGRGAEPVATLGQGGNSLRPHTASLETGFFRGASVRIGNSRLQTVILASHQARNAVLYHDEKDSAVYFQSIREDGYHRRPTELAARKNVKQTDIGGSLIFRTQNDLHRIGLNVLHSRFNHARRPARRLYNQQAFSGKTNTVSSIFGESTLGSLHLFTELAYSLKGGAGGIIGLQSSPHPRVDFALSLRHYANNFHSFYSQAFAESSEARNEQGVYLGCKLHLPYKLSLSAYFDYFRFPSARFRLAKANSPGYESLLRLSWVPNKNRDIYFQYQLQEKERTVAREAPLPYLVSTRRHIFWLHLAHNKRKNISFQHRLQISHFNDRESSTGFLVYSEMRSQLNRLRSSLRLAYFQTEDYDSRIYTYERNVLWAFSFPAFSGQGIRAYWLNQYNINRRLSCWLRWASTRYLDREEIRSGPETISGPWLHQLTFQLKYDF